MTSYIASITYDMNRASTDPDAYTDITVAPTSCAPAGWLKRNRPVRNGMATSRHVAPSFREAVEALATFIDVQEFDLVHGHDDDDLTIEDLGYADAARERLAYRRQARQPQVFGDPPQ